MDSSEFDNEKLGQLVDAFNASFENLGESLLNGDFANNIISSLHYAANNPLCRSLIVCVFVLFGFHLFSSLTRSIR